MTSFELHAWAEQVLVYREETGWWRELSGPHLASSSWREQTGEGLGFWPPCSGPPSPCTRVAVRLGLPIESILSGSLVLKKDIFLYSEKQWEFISHFSRRSKGLWCIVALAVTILNKKQWFLNTHLLQLQDRCSEYPPLPPFFFFFKTFWEAFITRFNLGCILLSSLSLQIVTNRFWLCSDHELRTWSCHTTRSYHFPLLFWWVLPLHTPNSAGILCSPFLSSKLLLLWVQFVISCTNYN